MLPPNMKLRGDWLASVYNALVEEITLLTLDTTMDADRELEEAVRKAMVYDKRLSAQPIEISVKDGIVYLTGTVQYYGRAVAAYEVAASVPGVREVSKRLVVEPPGDFRDDEVANHVRAALNAHSEVMKAAITVSVSGGVATLEGSVRDTWQYAVAEDVARSARGSRRANRLAVDIPNRSTTKRRLTTFYSRFSISVDARALTLRLLRAIGRLSCPVRWRRCRRRNMLNGSRTTTVP